MIYQSDIFGNIKSAEDVCSKSVGNKSIKQKYRQMYGYDNNHICKDCQHLKAIYNRDKRYYKCELMGISYSEATDIRLKDIACRQWAESKTDNA